MNDEVTHPSDRFSLHAREAPVNARINRFRRLPENREVKQHCALHSAVASESLH